MATLNVTAGVAATPKSAGILNRLFRAVENYFVMTRTYNELNELTDKQLRDIGVYRSDIPAIAMGKK